MQPPRISSSSAPPKAPTWKPSARRSCRAVDAAVLARPMRCIFIDRSLSTYFASMAAWLSPGARGFSGQISRRQPGVSSFAAAGSAQQIAFLKTVDRTPFFEITRTLTVLGMFSSPKYGGNFQGSGWKMMGFVDQHAFAPPFGYYDAEYKGFVPYPRRSTLDGPQVQAATKWSISWWWVRAPPAASWRANCRRRGFSVWYSNRARACRPPISSTMN